MAFSVALPVIGQSLTVPSTRQIARFSTRQSRFIAANTIISAEKQIVGA